ncbi:class I SAM-dependent methyltransferase [Pseudanabaena sp. Chao 1811]|uniref:class I SAM-dependent methyltransferase n=1 Tax=Pseudanabaena sp. Chao 1811 TaxID=2963092 RepID=UPI0022F3D9CC|nr:methyltransferase domain-containing protein [Pseudanabaena sp. Chao 1811]
MNKLIPRLEFLAQSLFWSQNFCPHCGSQDLQEVAKKYKSIGIEHCNDCGLFFTSPIYKSSFFSDFYDKLYQAEGSTTDMPNAEQLSDLISKKFEGSDKYFSDRIKAISDFLEGRNLLEIGSSWGYFIYQAKLQGFNVTGIEISDTRRQFGRENLGVDILKNISNLGSKKFDLIYTAHTLEHFTDLSTIFTELYEHLEIDGKLIIEVPNFDFLAYGNSLLSIIGAVHPVGFSSKFFEDNLPKYGFKSLKFYDSWDKFPNDSNSKSSGDILLLLAEK